MSYLSEFLPFLACFYCLFVRAWLPGEEKADPARMFDINAGGTLNVLAAARHAEVERVVFVSLSYLKNHG
jgi:nucleoside-diphosphate-sugar epimerase